MNSKKHDDLVTHFSHVRHNVKNHISVVLAFAELLQLELDKKHPDMRVAVEYLAKINKRAKETVKEIDQELSQQQAIELRSTTL